MKQARNGRSRDYLLKLIKFTILLFLCCIQGEGRLLHVATAVGAEVPSFPTFFLKSYEGRCLDVGANPQIGSPVLLYDCGRTVAQQIGIQELRSPLSRPIAAEPHAVLLHARTFCIGARGNPPPAGMTLELEQCSGSAGQQFVLDGDSIILAANRGLVVQPQGASGANGTPITVDLRILSDTEFWDFLPTDNKPKALTTGFKAVLCNENDPNDPPLKCEKDLRDALQSGPNTVVVFGGSANFSDLQAPVVIPDRVTIRGGRRFT